MTPSATAPPTFAACSRELRAIADELAETEAALLAWRASPPPVDLSQAEEARQRANKAADVRLDRELKAIWARVRSGELDGEE
jgi:hypothetical protein